MLVLIAATARRGNNSWEEYNMMHVDDERYDVLREKRSWLTNIRSVSSSPKGKT